METAAAITIGTLLSAFTLWIGMKFTGVGGSFLAMILVAGIASLFELIPVAGGIISVIVLFYLICKWTDANFFPDAVLMVIVAKAVGLIGVLLLCQYVA